MGWNHQLVLYSTTKNISFLLLLKESHGCMSFGWCMATCHEYLWGGIEWWTSTRAKEAWQKITTRQTGQVGGFKYLSIFFIFIPTWGNDPIWQIFFKWVEAIKQMGKTKSLNRGTREPPSQWISSHKLSQVVPRICGIIWHFFRWGGRISCKGKGLDKYVYRIPVDGWILKHSLTSLKLKYY